MSIETEFQSTIQNVQNAYNGLNNLGATIPQDKTIENIKSCLDEIYDNLPKTSYQEGTEINLGKTIKGKLDYENGVVGIGQTEQDSTPTPSTPIAINSVTGNQDVVVGGKNLVEGLELGEINAQTGAESSASNIVRTINYIPYSRLKSYRQSVNGENLSSGTNLRFYNKNKEYIGYAIFGYSTSITDVEITKGTGVTTTDLEPKYFRIRVGTSVLQTDSKYMIATDNDLTYEPYITPTSYQLSLGEYEIYKDGFISKEGDNWYVNNYYREIEADDTLTWSMDSNTSWASNRFICQNLPSLGVTTQTTFTNAYCNYATVGNVSDYTSHLNTFILRYINNRNRVDCMFNLASVDELKTILANNPMKILFKGTELIKTPITDETLISQLNAWYNAHSNNGTTIITSNGELPMIIKVRALKGE